MSLIAAEQVNLIISLFFKSEVVKFYTDIMVLLGFFVRKHLIISSSGRKLVRGIQLEKEKEVKNIWFLSTLHQHPAAGHTEKSGEDGYFIKHAKFHDAEPPEMMTQPGVILATRYHLLYNTMHLM